MIVKKIDLQIERYDSNDIKNKIFELHNKCFELQKEFEFNDADVRKVVFNLFSINCANLMYGFLLANELNKPQTYEIINIELPTENIEKFLKDNSFNLFNSQHNNFFFSIFMDFENYLRIIALAYGFQKIRLFDTYTFLIKQLNLGDDFKKFMVLISRIRNSMHNAGFYSGDTDTISYIDKSYTFNKNEPVMYSNIFDKLFYFEEILKYVQIINTSSRGVEDIEHNYSKINYLQFEED